MIIKKESLTKIEKNCLFLIGKSKIDSDYFIDRINQGVEESNNNFKTNVVGHMTDWKYFCQDKKFIEFLFPILDKLDEYPFVEEYALQSAWGIIENWGGRTIEHNHSPALYSGVLYLNNHSQELIFPAINEKVKPEKGKFVLFSADLRHKANRIICDKPKYAISFNLIHK
jgi:hypothetical protein